MVPQRTTGGKAVRYEESPPNSDDRHTDRSRSVGRPRAGVEPGAGGVVPLGLRPSLARAGLRRRRARPRHRPRRIHLLRVHHRDGARQPPAGSHRHLGLAARGLALLHRTPVRLDRAAGRPLVGAGGHPDLTGCLLLARSVDHVLRRGDLGSRRRHRVQLPVGRDRDLALSRPGLRRPFLGAARLPVGARGRHRPESVRRPPDRRPLPGLEVERRGFPRAGAHLVATAERERHEPRRLTDPADVPGHPGLPVGDDHREPQPGRGRGDLFPPLLDGHLGHALVLGDVRDLQRPARPVQPAGDRTVPPELRGRSRTGRRLVLPDRVR